MISSVIDGGQQSTDYMRLLALYGTRHYEVTEQGVRGTFIALVLEDPTFTISNNISCLVPRLNKAFSYT